MSRPLLVGKRHAEIDKTDKAHSRGIRLTPALPNLYSSLGRGRGSSFLGLVIDYATNDRDVGLSAGDS